MALVLTTLTMLAPDTTAFTTMLMDLSPSCRRTVPAGNLCKGDFVNESKRQWVVLETKLKNPDDWFSEEKLAVLGRPWLDSETSRIKYEWLEDKLFPRYG